MNKANAGQSIPMKFSLGGNRGLAIFKTHIPRSAVTSCSNDGADDDIETYARPTAAASKIRHTSVQYTYVWKTDKALAGQCVTFQLGLIDGSNQFAYFKFK